MITSRALYITFDMKLAPWVRDVHRDRERRKGERGSGRGRIEGRSGRGGREGKGRGRERREGWKVGGGGRDIKLRD